MTGGVSEIAPDAILDAKQLAHALTERGLPTTPATLAAWARKPDGPPFHRWGKMRRYLWREAWGWACARLGVTQ